MSIVWNETGNRRRLRLRLRPNENDRSKSGSAAPVFSGSGSGWNQHASSNIFIYILIDSFITLHIFRKFCHAIISSGIATNLVRFWNTTRKEKRLVQKPSAKATNDKLIIILFRPIVIVNRYTHGQGDNDRSGFWAWGEIKQESK